MNIEFRPLCNGNSLFIQIMMQLCMKNSTLILTRSVVPLLTSNLSGILNQVAMYGFLKSHLSRNLVFVSSPKISNNYSQEMPLQ